MYARTDRQPNPMFEHLVAEFSASQRQFEQNMHVIHRRESRTPRRDPYLGVTIHTARNTFTGRIFDLMRDGDSVTLCTAPIECRDHFDPTDAVFINVGAIEAIEVTESFACTFEVGITRDNLHEVLNSFHASATEHKDEDSCAGAAIKRAVDAWSGTQSQMRNVNLDAAERHWLGFCSRTGNELGVEQQVPGSRQEWYRSTVESDIDAGQSRHYGEMAFRHMHHGMPSDYLYADTRQAVQRAYRAHLAPSSDPWAQSD